MEQRLYEAQTKQFAKVAPLGLAASLGNGILVIWVLRHEVDGAMLAGWLGAVLLTILMRLPFYYDGLGKHFNLRRLYVGGALFAGVVWGAAAVFLFPAGSLSHQVFLAFVIGGMTAGAAGTYSVLLSAYLAFALPAVLPLLFRLALVGDQMHLVMAGMGLLFLFILSAVAWQSNRTLNKYFLLCFAKADLARHLSEANEKVETANQGLLREISQRQQAEKALQEANERLEQRIAYRTRELAELNRTLEEDIAKRRLTEDTLRQTNELLERFFSTTSLKIAYLDREFRFIRVNLAYAEANQQAPDYFVGKNHFDLYPDPGNRAIFREVLQKGVPFSAKARPHRSDGETTFWDWELLPVRNSDGRVEGLALFLIDVTQWKQTEDSLREAQKLEALGVLASGVAHDFNNILGAMLANTELAMYKLERNHPVFPYLEKVTAAGQRAASLIGQILAFRRRTARQRQAVALQPLVEEVARLLRPTLPADTAIRLRLDPDCPPVAADSSQLHQVLMNLCTNAIHAMRESGGILEIGLRQEVVTPDRPSRPADLKPGSYACLTVSDSGRGMDEEQQKQIFKPYYTTKRAGEGTGLGLAIVVSILKETGGEIAVQSRPGQGSTFTVYLPLADRIPAEVQSAADLPRINGHVLLVDQEKMVSLLGKHSLELLGCRVQHFTSGSEALASFQASPEAFDVVITGQTAADLSGPDLAREVTRLRPEVPVILAMDPAKATGTQSAKQLGFRAVITKPYAPETLAQLLAPLLSAPQKKTPVPAGPPS